VCLLAAEHEPPLGSHVVTPRRGHLPHGSYVGGGTVVHYAGLARGLHRGPLEEVLLAPFTQGRCVWIRSYAVASFDCRELIRRARFARDCNPPRSSSRAMSRPPLNPAPLTKMPALASDRAAVLVTLHCFECVGPGSGGDFRSLGQLCSQRPQRRWTRHSCLKVSSSQDFIRHGFGSCCNSGETVRAQSEGCNEEQADSCQGHVKSRRPRGKL